MKTRKFRWLLLVCMLAACSVEGACQQELFTPSDAYNESRTERYYGEESAKQARAARQRASDMGFGFATGAGEQ